MASFCAQRLEQLSKPCKFYLIHAWQMELDIELNNKDKNSNSILKMFAIFASPHYLSILKLLCSFFLFFLALTLEFLVSQASATRFLLFPHRCWESWNVLKWDGAHFLVFSSPGKWHLGLNCENSTDLCHHPSVHGFRHFFGIPLTNLRDCTSGHGTVFQFQKYLPYRSAAIVCATATFLHCIGIVAISYRLVLRVMALFVTLALLIVGFVMAVPYFNCILMRDHNVVEQPFDAENLTQRMTHEAVDFIERCLCLWGLAQFSHTEEHFCLNALKRPGLKATDVLHSFQFNITTRYKKLQKLAPGH